MSKFSFVQVLTYCANNKRLTTEEFVAECTKRHGGKYRYDKTMYSSSHEKVTITCQIHGDFEQVAYYHLQGAGCPSCNASRLEEEINQLLDKNSVRKIRQCRKDTFEWLGQLSLDFYLIDYNIAIECQGKQHYDEIEFFGGRKALNETMDRDKRKYDLCKEYGIELIYYTDEENLKKHSLGCIYSDGNKLINHILKHNDIN